MNAPETFPAIDVQEFLHVSPADLHPSPTNPRRTFPGFEIEECIQTAWNEIKDLKGKMINGVFVKEADL
jgi:hypothetical protein